MCLNGIKCEILGCHENVKQFATSLLPLPLLLTDWSRFQTNLQSKGFVFVNTGVARVHMVGSFFIAGVSKGGKVVLTEVLFYPLIVIFCPVEVNTPVTWTKHVRKLLLSNLLSKF